MSTTHRPWKATKAEVKAPPSLAQLLLDRLVTMLCLLGGLLVGVYLVGPPLLRLLGRG